MVPCHVLAGGLPPFLIFSEALSSPSVYRYWYRPGCTSPTAEMGDYGAEEVERADPSPMAAWPRRPPARPRIRRQTGWRSAPPPLKGRSWLCRRFCSKPALGFGPMLWPPRPFLGGLTGVLARARGTWAGAFRSDATSGATGQRGNPVVALCPNPRYEYQYQYPSHPCTWPRWRSKPLPASTRSASVYGVGLPVAEWADASPRDAPATCVRSLCEQRGSPPLAALSAASSEMLHPLLDIVAKLPALVCVLRHLAFACQYIQQNSHAQHETLSYS